MSDPTLFPVADTSPARVERREWLQGVASVPGASIDLVYADPPFNTGKRQRGRQGVNASYTDAWPTTAAYTQWLKERLEATIPALKPTASILLHIDYRVCHHARLVLDQLLGEDRFVNHLIWMYGLGGSSPRTFARKHDDILFYCLDPARYYFEAPMVPATSNRMKGQMKKATDVIDIPSLNNMAIERTGYPTQKPLALLELLIRACCPMGGTVLDPCCGSGTTLVAAVSAGRCAIGFDESLDAVKMSAARLANAKIAGVK